MARSGLALLGVDIGTTHCKAGLFLQEEQSLQLVRASSRSTISHKAPAGYSYYDPDELWLTVASAMREAAVPASPVSIAAVGIASMAETGLLVDRRTGAPRSVMLPWFDTVATRYAEISTRLQDPGARAGRFSRSGIRPSFKASLAKLIWLRMQDEYVTDHSVWLSAADYIVFRLTGRMATDYSLAGRTLAFRIDQKAWDGEWLEEFGFRPELFPDPLPSGIPAGASTPEGSHQAGLADGTPVSISGHDHICAAFAAGAAEPGLVFDSMGTAETLVGALEERVLGEKEFTSGLAYGCHVAAGRYYWLGGLSASGGSIEWLRSILGDPPLSYTEIESLSAQASQDPTGILYFPYLSGSGSPHTEPEVRGAFIGLDAAHRRPEMVKAVFEGTALEMEYIRRAAEQATGQKIDRIIASGGGTRQRAWMQIKADVSGCRFEIPCLPEATLLGAALIAGLGAGVYADQGAALAARPTLAVETILPDSNRRRKYKAIFESAYLPFQAPLRAYGKKWDDEPDPRRRPFH